MSRLEELNDTIVKVASNEDAIKLVKKWLPHQAEGIDKGGLATPPGVRNCSLIAEFIITYYLHDKKVDYFGRITSKASGPKKAGGFDFRERVTSDPQVFYGAVGGHELALIREGDLYGLYQAWEGKYHVFPRLNDDDESHNIYGSDDETVELINNEIAYLERETGTGIDLKQIYP